MSLVNLDLRGQPPEKQMAELMAQFKTLRGQHATMRALLDGNPARLYVSLLEGGFRVRLERSGPELALVLEPDGSTPRRQPGAHSLVAHPDGRVYVNTTEDRVAVIDAASRRVLRHIAVGRDPQHLELSPDGTRLYVANSGSKDVSVVDTATDTVIASGPTGRRPLLPCVASDGTLFLPSSPDETVTALDAGGRPLATLPVGESPHDIAVSPDARWAYQPNTASHTLTIIDAQKREVVGEIAAGQGPGHIAFTRDSRFAFVANTLSDDLTVVDVANHAQTGTIPAGAGAHMPILSHDGRTGYVANFVSDDLTVWDVERREARGRIPVGIYPHSFGISPDDAWLVVSNTGESSVCVADARIGQTVAKLEVGGGPGHVAFDPEGECAFVGCQISNQVAVIDFRRQQVVELVEVG
ncbi:MAG TPA: beta-propeller fold lactonase family protein [Chloroflexota bacterium]|nr:beta-propeller fold lactonase family protein [Chloroflexota bacterium]